ncbi:uncharacterized protein LOC133918885 [Phragmites australis]|uniref:uncharacterized protein LOC133918885 n=1 Tax=Phragmites australis TaxID=29695 RepID=UPI002D77191A|nr:uncharacterized protein LOC133918885 [Phragmites australis]XP_062218971.1 uncharacterized protein LOC133918885 [Phragmites australis]
MSQSACSVRSRRSLPEVPTGLPLIRCPTCKLATMIELTTKNTPNRGRKFFKCPRNQPYIPNGCNFYAWLEEYEQVVANGGMLVDSAWRPNAIPDRTESTVEKLEEASMKKEAEKKEDVASVKEIARWGKAILVLGLLNSTLMVFLLVVVLVK